MNHNIGRVILGLLLIILSLYGGSYVLHIYPTSHWIHFPVFMTTIFTAIGGVALIITGTIK